MLFDLDGTLLDNAEVVIDAYFNALVKYDFPLKSREFIGSLMGRSTFETARGLGIPEDKLDLIDEFFWEYFADYAKKLEGSPYVFPGVRELLTNAKSLGIRFGVCTSNEANNAKVLLEKAGLDHFFETYVGSEHPVQKKPSAEPITYALKDMKFHTPVKTPEQVWFIGDTEFDVKAAQAAGVVSIGILQPSTEKMLLEARPDILTDSMEALSRYFSDNVGKTNNKPQN